MRHLGRYFALRVLLFVFGLIVVVAAILMLCSYAGVSLGVLLFTAFDAMLLYEVLIGPLLVEEQLSFLTASKIVSIGMALKAVVPFSALTAALMLVANTSLNPPLPLLWVAELALLFLLGLGLYFSLATSAHITSTEQRESTVRASVDGLRASANQLVVKASRIDSTDEAAKMLVSRIAEIDEELRYLSPVQDLTAQGIEESIAANIATLSRQIEGGATSTSWVRDAIATADDTLALIGQRKLLLSQ